MGRTVQQTPGNVGYINPAYTTTNRQNPSMTSPQSVSYTSSPASTQQYPLYYNITAVTQYPSYEEDQREYHQRYQGESNQQYWQYPEYNQPPPTYTEAAVIAGT